MKKTIQFLLNINNIVTKHHGFLFAKSLAFQTLFCFIPAIVTVLFMAGSIDLLDQPLIDIKHILAEQFVPQAVQNSLFSQLDIAVTHASSASIFAISIFLFSTFSLISGIQEIYYQFSEQECNPPLKNSLIVYLLFIIVTLAAIIISIALAYLFTQPISSHFNFPSIILKLLNFFLLATMIFTFFTLISPVQFKKRVTFLISLLIGIILFFAQKLFLIYVIWFPGYMLVYGAIAFLPLLFFWLYIYWVIFLYGYAVLLELHKK